MNQNTLSIATLLFALIIFVHTAHAQMSVGIRGGVNLSGILLIDELGETQESEMIPRFQIGLTLDIPVATDFYIQPAALYSGKGFKQNGGWLAGPDNTFKATASYFEVPLNLLYTPRFGPGNIVVGAGPYVAYGTGGKWKANGRQIKGRS
ncbi:PorT family protein [Sphingobacterium sp. SGG-5]|uniref:outer membrane beta-barrel protein n=1 Tax=Sphingobacterium sp. SGG-5 TaxID=2710881 RepID=UPI0013EB12B3|nr:outer membrane beta-barrel protein [Sphingobacterium sp. SGG-5]NGM61153.1 PorT family protein [Sphingobacterium sp. SGG-5]